MFSIFITILESLWGPISEVPEILVFGTFVITMFYTILFFEGFFTIVFRNLMRFINGGEE